MKSDPWFLHLVVVWLFDPRPTASHNKEWYRKMRERPGDTVAMLVKAGVPLAYIEYLWKKCSLITFALRMDGPPR